MSQLAVNLSMIFTEVPLLERFALASQMGFKHIEIQFPYELSIEQIQQQLSLHQLKICLINAPAGDLMQGGNGLACDPNKTTDFQQALDQALVYAQALHIPRINILAGRQASDCDWETCFNQLVANLKVASDLFSQHQIQTVFEMINGYDMPGFLIQTFKHGQDVLEAVNHPNLKMQYDVYHMAMMQENILQQLQNNIAQIGHIQFADVPGRHEPDTGKLDFTQILKTLQQSNYDNFLAAEYKPSTSSLDSFAWKNKYFQIS